MSEHELHVGRFTEDAHIGKDAVIDQMVRADSIAAIFLADKFIAPLRFFDFAHHSRDEDISLQANPRTHQRPEGLHVADERTLHVVNAETIDHAFADNGIGFVADAGKKSFAAGVRSIHVAVEHQAFAVAGAFPEADHVGTAFLDLLPTDLESVGFERPAHVLPHREFLARGAGDVHHVASHGDNFFFAYVRKNLIGEVALYFARGFLHGAADFLFFPTGENRPGRNKVFRFHRP